MHQVQETRHKRNSQTAPRQSPKSKDIILQYESELHDVMSYIAVCRPSWIMCEPCSFDWMECLIAILRSPIAPHNHRMASRRVRRPAPGYLIPDAHNSSKLYESARSCWLRMPLTVSVQVEYLLPMKPAARTHSSCSTSDATNMSAAA